MCPEGLKGSVADGYLSLFNLTGLRVSGVVAVRQSRTEVQVCQGVQRVTAVGTDHDVVLEAGTARVEPARFVVRRVGGGAVVLVGEVVLTWTAGVAPAATLATSVDGRAYTPAAPVGRGRRVGVAARFMAVGTGWRTGQAGLVSVVVRPG